MADSITSFEVYRSATSENGPWGSPIATLPGTARSYADSANPSPRLWYKLVGRTAEGLGGGDGIPYNVVAIGSAAWNKVIGGAASDGGQSVAIAPDGNIIAAGTFSGTVDFTGNGTGTPNVSILTSAGGYDLFIAKYSPAGSLIWVKRYGKTLPETVRAMAVDTAGNIFMGGALYGTCNYGGSDLTSSGDSDPWLAKYDSSGNHLWSIDFLKAPNSGFVNAISADSQGNVYVTGSFQGGNWLNLLPINNGHGLYSDYNSIDAFLIKFNSGGVCQWAKNFANYGGTDDGLALEVDSNNNIVVGGYTQSGCSLGDANIPSGGFLGKFSANGNHIWSRPCAQNNAGKVLALAISPTGSIFTTGYFYPSTCDFGGGQKTVSVRQGQNLYVAKYNANGDYQWAEPVRGDHAYGWGMSCAAGTDDSVVFCGYFRGPLIFGSIVVNSYSTEVDNGFIAKYSSSGHPIWAKGLIGPGYSRFSGVKINAQNDIFATGNFSETNTFNGQSLTSAGGSDILLARILPTG